jgi:hypothetical protein
MTTSAWLALDPPCGTSVVDISSLAGDIDLSGEQTGWYAVDGGHSVNL